jgi:hypothetical protein
VVSQNCRCFHKPETWCKTLRAALIRNYNESGKRANISRLPLSFMLPPGKTFGQIIPLPTTLYDLPDDRHEISAV